MTKKEIQTILNEKKFTSEMRSYRDDVLRNLFEEIYYEGMRAGYELAKARLDLINRLPFGCADDFLDKNMDKIREILDLCKAYEETKE